jgi:hypothetical protein
VPLGRFHLVPDAIFLVTTPDRSDHLFALEVYNGHDTQRVHTQLRKHLQEQAEGAIAAAYGLALPCRVLLVFDSEAALQAVLRRVRADPQFAAAEPYFAFNTLARVNQDFARGWFYFSGRQGAIF